MSDEQRPGHITPNGLPIIDGNYRVECTIHNLHGTNEQRGVLPLEVRDGRAKVVISTIPGAETPREYLEVPLTGLYPHLNPQAGADFLIPDPLDGRKLRTKRH